MYAFTHNQPAQRVLFECGAIERLPDELRRVGFRRALLIATPDARFTRDAARRIGDALAGICAIAAMHVPIETVRAARARADEVSADCLLAVGGGSTIGLAKAVALERNVPIVAVPTTYAGSEMTPIYGISEGGIKRTGRDPRVVPQLVLYDPLLTATLPPRVAGPSGMNAIAHAVEALYAKDANPVIDLIAAEAIRTLSHALPVVVTAPDDIDARATALYGAWLAGISLGAVSMALHHRLCHVLGGSFNLPHADVHTVMLPQVTGFNAEAAPQAMSAIAAALKAPDAAAGLFDLAVALGAPTSLETIGMPYESLDRVAEIVAGDPPNNPRPVDHPGVRALLERAYRGERPEGS